MDEHYYSITALLLACLSLMIVISSPFEPTEPDTVQVSRTAEVTRPPNLVRATISIVTEDPEAVEAQNKNRNLSSYSWMH